MPCHKIGFKLWRGTMPPKIFEDVMMMNTYNYVKETGDVKRYFHLGPSHLRKIKYEVECKFNDILKQ